MEKWKKAVEMVKEFYEAFGQNEFLENPKMQTFERIRLRGKLFWEELEEYNEAEKAGDRVGKLDACCDMAYIYIGTMLESANGNTHIVAKKIYLNESNKFDLIWDEVEENGFESVFMDAFEEVHRSNMSKLGLDGKPIFREDGKIIKGPNYFPPNLEQFLKEDK